MVHKQFTEDWFSSNIQSWKKQLSHLRGKPVHFLEIGTFEGRSALWVLENILTHPDSRLYVIDHWKYVSENNNHVYKTFKKNIAPYSTKVQVLKGYSRDMLRGLKASKFDFVYIDANRHSQNVLEDAVMSFPLLKANALMILDDYTHNKEHNNSCPRPGIDCFMNMYSGEIKVLHTGWQVVLQKRKTPLLRQPCYSEHFENPKKTPAIYKDINKF